jgi:hypothetical protein
VMRSFRLMEAPEAGTAEATKPAGGGLPARSRERVAQNSFFGSCMLRTRLKWRFTAAAFLRLRSAVGFS